MRTPPSDVQRQHLGAHCNYLCLNPYDCTYFVKQYLQRLLWTDCIASQCGSFLMITKKVVLCNLNVIIFGSQMLAHFHKIALIYFHKILTSPMYFLTPFIFKFPGNHHIICEAVFSTHSSPAVRRAFWAFVLVSGSCWALEACCRPVEALSPHWEAGRESVNNIKYTVCNI